MNLSEAIRVGSKLREQAFGTLFQNKGPGKTCALGAAAECVGILGKCLDAGMLQPLYLRFDVLRAEPGSTFAPCSCERTAVGDELVIQIAHMNDHHKWSREAIAEWVETIENQLDAKVEAAKAVPPPVPEPEVALAPLVCEASK